METEKTLVWLTDTLNLDNQLMSKLSGPCAFVYFSPYYFSASEKAVYQSMSKDNTDRWHASINYFKNVLQSKGHTLHIIKSENPIDQINKFVKEQQITRVVFDLPRFAIWPEIADQFVYLDCKLVFVDSQLVNAKNNNRTAKSRWIKHAANVKSGILQHCKFSDDIQPLVLNCKIESYPESSINIDQEIQDLYNRIDSSILTYHQTRDKYNGQLNVSPLLNYGVVNLHNLFVYVAKQYLDRGYDLSKNEPPQNAILRQFAFCELSIITCRNKGIHLGTSFDTLAQKLLYDKSYEHYQNYQNDSAKLTWSKLANANTHDAFVNKILQESKAKGVMPNRARMFIAGWIWYNSPDAYSAHKWTIDLFNLILIDGQHPNNYTQSTGAWNLQYGRVMKLNKDRVRYLLGYPE